MGKAPKPTTVPPTRHLPYPVATSASVMPHHAITTPISRRPMTPPPTGDHHSNTWNPDMDETLMRARQQGMNWGPIASGFFPDKTANACRKRHERLMAQRNNSGDWDAAKMEALAKAYTDVRQQMWQLLADRMSGEKWSTVEAKCMEKGLKTLQTSSRTATRRERQAHNQSGSDCDDDYSMSFRRPRSSSHPNSDEGYDYPLFNQQRPSTLSSPINREPPHPPPSRTFSISSTLSSSFTPTLTSAPPFPSQISSSRQSPTNQQTPMLPSFSAAFGMPSISHASRAPVTTVS